MKPGTPLHTAMRRSIARITLLAMLFACLFTTLSAAANDVELSDTQALERAEGANKKDETGGDEPSAAIENGRTQATKAPEPAPEHTPGGTPDVTPKPTPQHTPDTALETTPEPTLEPAPQHTPGSTPDATPESTPQHTPDIAPEITLEPSPEPQPTEAPSDAGDGLLPGEDLLLLIDAGYLAVTAGQSLRLPVAARFYLDGETWATCDAAPATEGKEDALSEEGAVLYEGGAASRLFDQSIASALHQLTVDWQPRENSAGDGAPDAGTQALLPGITADGQPKMIIKDGQNLGYALLEAPALPIDTQPGDYAVAVRVSWIPQGGHPPRTRTFPLTVRVSAGAPRRATRSLSLTGPNGDTIVFTGQELKDALNSTTVSRIYLGYNDGSTPEYLASPAQAVNNGTITMPSGGPTVPAGMAKTIIGIDPFNGKRCTLAGYSSNTSGDTIRADKNADITFEGMDINWPNQYGLVTDASTSSTNVSVTARNVAFAGRQLMRCPRAGATLRVEGCDISLRNMGGQPTGLAQLNTLIFGPGKTTVAYNGTASNALLSSSNATGTLLLLVEQGADVNVTGGNGAYFISNAATHCYLDIRGKLYFETGSPYGMCYQYGSYSIEKVNISGELEIVDTNTSPLHAPLFVQGDVDVSGSLKITRNTSSTRGMYVWGGTMTVSGYVSMLQNNSGSSTKGMALDADSLVVTSTGYVVSQSNSPGSAIHAGTLTIQGGTVIGVSGQGSNDNTITVDTQLTMTGGILQAYQYPGVSYAALISGRFTCVNPEYVYLSSPSYAVMKGWSTSSSATFHTQVINAWTSANPASSMAGTNTRVWNLPGGQSFELQYTFTATPSMGVISPASPSWQGPDATAPTSATFNLGNMRALAMGRLSASLNPPVGKGRTVTGAAPASATVRVSEHALQGSTAQTPALQTMADVTAGANGTFVAQGSQPLKDGSRVIALVYDGQLNAYIQTDLRLPAGAVSLEPVPALNFGRHSLGFTEALLPRTDANWHLTVRDTRADADEGWNLSLKLASPFTSAVDGVSTLPNTGGWGLVMADGLGGFHSLDGTAYPIASKNYRPGDVPDEDTLDIGWAAERGLMLRVPPATPVVEGDYCATLTWTLSVGP